MSVMISKLIADSRCVCASNSSLSSLEFSQSEPTEDKVTSCRACLQSCRHQTGKAFASFSFLSNTYNFDCLVVTAASIHLSSKYVQFCCWFGSSSILCSENWSVVSNYDLTCLLEDACCQSSTSKLVDWTWYAVYCTHTICIPSAESYKRDYFDDSCWNAVFYRLRKLWGRMASQMMIQAWLSSDLMPQKLRWHSFYKTYHY